MHKCFQFCIFIGPPPPCRAGKGAQGMGSLCRTKGSPQPSQACLLSSSLTPVAWEPQPCLLPASPPGALAWWSWSSAYNGLSRSQDCLFPRDSRHLCLLLGPCRPPLRTTGSSCCPPLLQVKALARPRVSPGGNATLCEDRSQWDPSSAPYLQCDLD